MARPTRQHMEKTLKYSTREWVDSEGRKEKLSFKQSDCVSLHLG